MANYTDKPKKHASRDIAVDKLDFYTEPHKSPKKQDKIKGRPKSGWARFCYGAFPQAECGFDGKQLTLQFEEELHG
mgnify:CR=1 FL=1